MASDPPGRGRRLRVPSVSGVVKGTATIVGLVSGILGLVFLVRPGLQPDEPPPPPPPPARTRATLDPIALEPSITRRAYLARTDQPTDAFTPEQLAVRGPFVRIRVRIDGFSGVPITLSREVIDEGSGEEVSQDDAITITPPAAEVDRDWQDWVPIEEPGRYFLIYKLLAPGEDAALNTLKTEPFDVSSG